LTNLLVFVKCVIQNTRDVKYNLDPEKNISQLLVSSSGTQHKTDFDLRLYYSQKMTHFGSVIGVLQCSVQGVVLLYIVYCVRHL